MIVSDGKIFAPKKAPVTERRLARIDKSVGGPGLFSKPGIGVKGIPFPEMVKKSERLLASRVVSQEVEWLH